MEKIDFKNIISALKSGEIIVYPTDTLYGFGADIYNEKAVKKLYYLKKRPLSEPLPIAVYGIKEISKLAFLNEKSKIIAEKFLPGNLTLILKKKDIIPNIITAQKDKVAIRVPDNKIAISLLKKYGPLTATSANIHGKKTPHVINDLKMQFSDSIKIFIDDGILNKKASTIVDLSEEKIKVLRQGAISKKLIMDAVENG